MQHYGLPTRLLDWTEGALIGLFFAVRNQQGSSDPCVWVLNPWWLNSKSAEEESIFFADDISQTPEDKELVDRYLYDSEELPDFPISISPPHVNRRITAQIAGFTVHGSIKSGLNDLWEGDEGKQLAQLTINKEDLKSLIGEVSMCGIKESIIFPDLDGLSREMKRDYGLGQPFSGD